jgi:hypothetical protein
MSKAIYKIRHVRVTEGDNERTHFCNWILQAVHGSLLDTKLTFFTDEACFHLVATSMLKQ